MHVINFCIIIIIINIHHLPQVSHNNLSQYRIYPHVFISLSTVIPHTMFPQQPVIAGKCPHRSLCEWRTSSIAKHWMVLRQSN